MLPRLAAALAEFLRQNATSRIRKAAYKRRLRHWATECFFTLSFYCELNFIERYWCRVKWFMRENCEFDFQALKTGALELLASVCNASIHGFYRLALRAIDAYFAGLQYGTEEFKQKVYKSHRQVVAAHLVSYKGESRSVVACRSLTCSGR